MFIRFTLCTFDPSLRAQPGIFQAAGLLPYLADNDWRGAEIERAYAWFNRHLAVPDALSRAIGRQGLREGVCWFRDEATQCIDQARYLAWLIEEAGLPTQELRSARPGIEIWRDTAQVVAVPDRDTIIRAG